MSLALTGFNIIPVNSDNIPTFEWKRYQTERYAGNFPDGCNYALVCGFENVVCLDIESQIDHDVVLQYKYVDEIMAGLKTRIDRSPHGYHVLVTADRLPKNSVWDNGVCRIEVKSLGSLVTMPPSKKDGFEYYNLNSITEPLKVDMYALLEHIQKIGYTGHTGRNSRTFHFDKKLARGERNIQIFKLISAVHKLEPQVEPTILLSLARYVYTEHCESGKMDEREIQEIVKSVMKYDKK